MSQALPLAATDAVVSSPRESALRELVRLNPQDRVARLKLHVERGHRQDFLREAAEFRRGLNGNLNAPDWRAICSIGLRLFPGSPVFADVAPSESPQRRLGDDGRARPRFEALARSYEALRDDPRFPNELDRELLLVARRPTPLLHAQRLSAYFRGAQIYLKREDLVPPGMYMNINVVGQALLARRLGKRQIVTGAVHGSRGVLVAETAARLGLKAVVYMASDQIAREPENVFRMWLTGAETHGSDVSRLRNGDIREAAIDHWVQHDDSMLVLGIDHGPEPYPTMAREFSAVIGRECHRQILAYARSAPDLIVAGAGDSPEAIGLFQPFLVDPRVRLATVQTKPDFSPGGDEVRPPPAGDLTLAPREHRWLEATGRVERHTMDAPEVREAITRLSQMEGVIPTIDTAYAVAWACHQATRMKPEQSVVVAVCAHAEGDLQKVGRSMGVPL